MPDHEPLVVVRDWPWTAEPVIDGAAVLDAPGGAATAEVAAESADASPALLLAVTTERTVLPMSPSVSV